MKNISTKIVAALTALSFALPAHAEWTSEEKKLILDTNANLIQLATGVDIKTLPIIGGLFPKQEVIDYERIARDVSRVIDNAFEERALFTRDVNLKSSVEGLQRLVETTYTDSDVLRSMEKFDYILKETSSDKYRLNAVGYYASAAQMNLNAAGMRVGNFPNEAKMKTYLWKTAVAYRNHIMRVHGELYSKALEKASVGVTECKVYTSPYIYAYFTDNGQGQMFGGSTTNQALEQCMNARSELTSKRAKAATSTYLPDLAAKWQDVRFGAQYGAQGLNVVKKLLDPGTELAIDTTGSGNLRKVAQNFFGYSSPEAYDVNKAESACSVLGRAANEEIKTGRMTAQKVRQLNYLVGCPF